MAKCFIVAEAGSNHDGDFDQALQLIDIATDAGADAVKFQCLDTLPKEWLPELMAYAEIDCFATPFDVDAVVALDRLDVPFIKVAAPEIVYLELLEAVAATGRPVILSTGMANADEIETALEIVGTGVTLLQCTTAYPAKVEQANLMAMKMMHLDYGVPTGLSDHTQGIAIPIAAAALGASVIEKHFTISRDLKGPDHPFAIEPHELKQMVDGIREVEKALGDGRKDGPVEGELVENRGRRLKW